MQRVTLLLYGVIGGEVTSNDFVKAILAAGEAPITLRINSPGGSVFEAYAIFNALRDHKAGVECQIDGLAASAASYIAMAGGKITMAANAMFMAHLPSDWAGGTADALRAQADLLDKVKVSLVDAYVAKTGRPAAEIEAHLGEEKFLSAAEALAAKFIDAILEDDEDEDEQAPVTALKLPGFAVTAYGNANLRALLVQARTDRAQLRKELDANGAQLADVSAKLTGFITQLAGASARAADLETRNTAITAAVKTALKLDAAQIAELESGKTEPLAVAVEQLAGRKAVTLAAQQGGVPPVPSSETIENAAANELQAEWQRIAGIKDPMARARAHAAVSAKIKRTAHGKN